MRYLTAIFLILTLAASSSYASPLQLDTTKKYTTVPEIAGFRYWFGDIDYGSIVYIGTEDLSGFETELQLYFKNKFITSALLILGPAGLNDVNCVVEYKKVISLLNTKYGHFKFKKIEKDPLMNDLLYVSLCHPIEVGLYSVTTVWNVGKTRITAVLIGDEGGFGIEIEYKFRPNPHRSTKKLLKAL